jgi:hypothetical protein
MAVAHSILVIVYHLLRTDGTYQDLGPNYFDERDRTSDRAYTACRFSSRGGGRPGHEQLLTKYR